MDDNEKSIFNFRLTSMENRMEDVEDDVQDVKIEMAKIKSEDKSSFFSGLSLSDWVKTGILIFGMVSGSSAIVDYLGWGEGIDDRTKEELIQILEDE